MGDFKDSSSINWEDPKSKISPNFTVHEALWLPTWQCYHIPSDLEKKEIVNTAFKMEKIREYLRRSLHVHCWIRPKVLNNPKSKYHGKSYNAAVGGTPGSAHIEGKAVDFHASSLQASEVRAILSEMLEDFKIRMENTDQEGWVHIDTREPLPKKGRLFRP